MPLDFLFKTNFSNLKFNKNYSYFNNSSLNYKKYKEDGYVILRNIINKNLINDLKINYYKEIILGKSLIFRQNSGLAEKTKTNNKKYLINPIQNIQDLSKKKFSGYVNSVQNIVMSNKLKKILFFFLKSNPILIQTMQFHLNTETPPHHDGYYMNSCKKDGMLGVWFALEDIKDEAGKFFLIKKSNKKTHPKNAQEYSIFDHHKEFLEYSKRYALRNQKNISIPNLKCGDIIIWNNNTVHGSLRTINRNSSRFSLTAHYIKNDNKYFKGSKVITIKPKKYKKFFYVNNKDNNKIIYKLIMLLSNKFPDFYKLLIKIIRKTNAQ